MTYVVTSDVLQNISSVVAKLALDATFANLAGLATYTGIVIPDGFAPLFDIYAFSDQVLSIQRQTAFSVTGPPGNTFRNAGAPFLTIPNVVFEATLIRVPNLYTRWLVTNTAGVPTTVLEFVAVNRSI